LVFPRASDLIVGYVHKHAHIERRVVFTGTCSLPVFRVVRACTYWCIAGHAIAYACYARVAIENRKRTAKHNCSRCTSFPCQYVSSDCQQGSESGLYVRYRRKRYGLSGASSPAAQPWLCWGCIMHPPVLEPVGYWYNDKNALQLDIQCISCVFCNYDFSSNVLLLWVHLTSNKSISCRWRTRATRCITANVLQTKVDAQCDKLATELSWQRLRRSTFSI